jgi:uncharacterized protein YidB (DUF937 family)
MARGMPSMLALLGLLAVAGYQNRDKIGAALGGLQKDAGDPNTAVGGLANSLGGLFSGGPGARTGTGAGTGLGGILDGLGGGTGLSGGLGDLLNSFKTAGHGAVADSWVTPGVPTQGLTPEQVKQAVGDDNLAQLSQSTGLSRDELLKRLATAIPQTVDTLTPGGQMPTEDELRQKLLPAS